MIPVIPIWTRVRAAYRILCGRCPVAMLFLNRDETITVSWGKQFVDHCVCCSHCEATAIEALYRLKTKFLDHMEKTK